MAETAGVIRTQKRDAAVYTGGIQQCRGRSGAGGVLSWGQDSWVRRVTGYPDRSILPSAGEGGISTSQPPALVYPEIPDEKNSLFGIWRVEVIKYRRKTQFSDF